VPQERDDVTSKSRHSLFRALSGRLSPGGPQTWAPTTVRQSCLIRWPKVDDRKRHSTVSAKA